MGDADIAVASTEDANDWKTNDPAIRRALNDRWEWLEHQSKGSSASKRAAWRDLGDAGLAEDRVRQSYTGRYTIELLQNAHDACADGNLMGSVWFEIRKSALLIANQGVPFSAERIISLARLGSSEKARRRGRDRLIGYKGIGFTAVFEISDRPQVISKSVQFCFDRQKALSRVSVELGHGDGSEPVPARYFPMPLPQDAWNEDAEIVERLFAAGASSVIRLPFRDDCTPERVLQDLQDAITPELLLFAPAISKVEIRSAGIHLGWKRTPGRRVGKGMLQHLVSEDGERRSWLVRSRRVEVTADEVGALRDELWKSVRRLNVAAALPWTASGLDREPAPQRLFAYFPTADRLGRGLIIHGDFYLDEARRRIASSGPQGVISGRVGEAAADLVAELAESLVLVSEGNRLLACLAPIDRPDGYGEHLANKLDAALKQAKIVRPADNSRPRYPGELRRLSTKMALPRERGLVGMLDVRSDLVCPGDDRGRADDLLQRLGCEPIKPEEVASRIEPARARIQYGPALMLLEGWLKSLEPHVFWAVKALKTRPVVQDTAGKWRTIAEVLRRDPATPPLPSFLARPEVAIPTSAAARAFIERLEIDILSPGSALDRLLDYVGARQDGIADAECSSGLAFAWSLWQADSSIFEHKYNLGAIPVPVRSHAGRVPRGWSRADDVYFGSKWTGNPILDSLYGPFSKSEFLAEDPPNDSDVRQRFSFLRAIGVADHPRIAGLNSSLTKYWEWWLLPEVDAARYCPDGHPNTTRNADGSVMDRLDELLARVEKQPEFARVLARALLSSKDPYGPEARIRCTHGAHRASGGSRAIGYQRWRLEQTAWVPVTRHPSGAKVARSSEAWTGISRSGARLTLPRAALSHEDAKRLKLVNAEGPSREAVEHALRLLRESHPDLQKAQSEVRETAEWLARRLERTVHGKQPVTKAPPLPAITSDGYLWTSEPTIADLPGMPAFADIALLPPGRWTGLRRAYGLPVASALVVHDVELGARARVPPLLTDEQRAELLALLVRVGATESLTARRLAILREHTTSSLKVKWRSQSGETHVVENCNFHLMLGHDSANRIVSATLHRTIHLALETVSLGHVIASYLDVPELEHTVALYLHSRHQVVEQQGLTEDEIAEAKELLRRRGLAEEETEPSSGENLPLEGAPQTEGTVSEISQPTDVSAAPPPSARPAEPVVTPLEQSAVSASVNAERGTTTGVQTLGERRDYIDPSAVRFGASRKASPPTPRARREAGGRLERSAASAERTRYAVEGDAPTPNTLVEDGAMKIAEKYGLQVLGATNVRDVHLSNFGWDLEFHFADGHWIPVEVKGSSGQGPFIITRNEWHAARGHSDYMLLHVTNMGNPGLAALRIFRRLGERLTEQQMSSLSWVVERWAELEPEEVPIEVS